MRWLPPLLLLTFATGLFAAACVYGVVTVGVPTQDASPAVAAAEARDVSFAGWGMGIGAGLALASLLWLAILATFKWTQRTPIA